jgi:hypothetical protein
MSEEKTKLESEVERFRIIMQEEIAKLEAMKAAGASAAKISNQEENVEHARRTVERLEESAAKERWQNEKAKAEREKVEAERKLQERQTAALERISAEQVKPAATNQNSESPSSECPFQEGSLRWQIFHIYLTKWPDGICPLKAQKRNLEINNALLNEYRVRLPKNDKDAGEVDARNRDIRDAIAEAKKVAKSKTG